MTRVHSLPTLPGDGLPWEEARNHVALRSLFKRKQRPDQTPRHPRPTRLVHEGKPCITLAVQWASKGEVLAPRLAARWGLEVYGDELMELIAQQSRVPREVLAALDEGSTADFSFLMTSLLGSPYVVAEDFTRDLVRVIHQIAERGNCIILGRGAAFVLHGPRVLNVRVIEPYEQRLSRLQATRGMSYTEAEIALAEADSARCQFVEDHFKRDIDDPEAYDLVLNAQFFDEETMVELVSRAFDARRGG